MAQNRLDPDSIEPIRIIVRVPAQLRADFDASCKKGGVTMSQALRNFIEEWVAEDRSAK